MTTQEFSYEFDIYYNNIRSASAPGLDHYDKSVFLTNAQKAIVRSIYKGETEKLEGFEDIEINRRYLDALTDQYISINTTKNIDNIDENSMFFEVPNDLFIIAQERILIFSEDDCWNNKKIDVVPIRHDEFNNLKRNPFKKPKLKGLTVNAWRIDYGKVEGVRQIEIIYPEESDPQQYILRYLRKPKPIILQSLLNDDLSIDGETDEMTSELDSSLHDLILQMAVTQAKSIYDPKIN